MTECIRQIPASEVKVLDSLISEKHPMFPGFMDAMIRAGMYIVTDEHGTRLPTEKALSLLED